MSLHGLDVWGREVAETGLHIETGDKDGYCRATRGSLSIVPWAKRKTAQVLLQTFTPEGDAFLPDPRQVLKAKVAEINAKGFFPVVAFEVEFTCSTRDRMERRHAGSRRRVGRSRSAAHVRARRPGRTCRALRHDPRCGPRDEAADRHTIIKEAAPGQFEVNLKHRADPLRAADDVVMLRRIIMGCAAHTA